MKSFTALIFVVAVVAISAANGSKDNQQCNNCLTVAQVAKQILTAGITPAQVKAIGAMGCSILPDMIKSVCPGLIDEFYKNVNDLIAQVKALGAMSCNFVPGTFKNYCPSIVDGAYKKLYKMVVTDDASPQQLCKLAEMC